MEKISLFVLVITIYAGLYYQTGTEDTFSNNFVKWVIFIVVISPCILFMVYFCRQMRIEILKVALAKNVKLFRVLSCGCVDPDKFRELHDRHEKEDWEDDEELEAGKNVRPDAIVGFSEKAAKDAGLKKEVELKYLDEIVDPADIELLRKKVEEWDRKFGSNKSTNKSSEEGQGGAEPALLNKKSSLTSFRAAY